MYRGFYIELDEIELNRLMTSIHNKRKSRRLSSAIDDYADSGEIRDILTEYLMSENAIDVQHLKNDWFPHIRADIFLSHSHRDIDLAKQFADFLNMEFGLTTFIDSEVWGYSDELVDILLGEAWYEENEDRKIVAHVNIMLSSALTQMIDKTECLIFLNTENSVRSMTCTDRALTDSAWMYHELFISSILPKKKPYRCSKTATQESWDMLHTLPLDHLTYLSVSRLSKWVNEWDACSVFRNLYKYESQAQEALDKLYRMYPEDEHGL